MNSAQFWGNRATERIKEILKYGRYMLNDHILFVIIFAIGGGAFYYQSWVKTLDGSFPTPLVFAVIFAVLLSWGSVITFLKEPDKVFLLPLETELKPYFVRSALLTYIWHSYILFMFLLAVAPLYLQTIGKGTGFLQFAVLIFLLKAINLWIRWKIDYDSDKETILWDFIIRVLLNGAMVYLLLSKSPLFLAAVFVIFLLYGLYFARKAYRRGLPWERLIENEQNRMGNFYRLANLFTDVPHMKNPVKRRRWLDFLIRNIPFTSDKTYTYLLTRTFLRSGDYFGLFVRLTIIGGFLVWGFAGTYIGLAIAIFFIYLTGFQLRSLLKHHDAIIWTSLYPVDPSLEDHSYVKILMNILWTQNLVFTVLFITSGDWLRGLMLFILSSGFIYFWSSSRAALKR